MHLKDLLESIARVGYCILVSVLSSATWPWMPKKHYNGLINQLTSDTFLFIIGNALVKCGQTEQKLGQAERELVQAAANNFLQPLRAFLDGDMKTVQVSVIFMRE